MRCRLPSLTNRCANGVCNVPSGARNIANGVGRFAVVVRNVPDGIGRFGNGGAKPELCAGMTANAAGRFAFASGVLRLAQRGRADAS
jgi:hypothetical protein